MSGMERIRRFITDWLYAFAGVEREEDGYITAEYAVGIIAAVAFAGLLLTVIRSGAVQSLLTSIIETALQV